MSDPSRVETTLFLLVSVDGKITSGGTDERDSDRDWKRLKGVKEGLHQYLELEESIAINSLQSGRVMAKVGVNSRTDPPHKDERLTFSSSIASHIWTKRASPTYPAESADCSSSRTTRPILLLA